MASVSGYNVLTASNGKQGLEVAGKTKPDLILLDIMMPEMDGYTTLAALKADPLTAKIPVIMLTAVGFQLNKQLALNTGAVGYVTKPFEVRDLLSKIGQYLSG